MADDDKPFACLEPDCGMRFANEDHLSVHKMKHEMSLSLSSGTGKTTNNLLFVDQTPTPTKFLRNCEEIGLFSDLRNNPFEEAFKKATEHGAQSHGSSSADPHNLSVPHLDSLNTPATPQLLRMNTKQPEFIPLPGPDGEFGSTLDTPTPPIPREETFTPKKHRAIPSRAQTQTAAEVKIEPENLSLRNEAKEQKTDKDIAEVPDIDDMTAEDLSVNDTCTSSTSQQGSSLEETDDNQEFVSQEKVVIKKQADDEDFTVNVMDVSEDSQTSQDASQTSQEFQVTSSIPSTVSGTVNSLPIVLTTSTSTVPTATIAPGNVVVPKQAQCMVQVQLQLSDGRSMPVNIPAALQTTTGLPSFSPLVQMTSAVKEPVSSKVTSTTSTPKSRHSPGPSAMPNSVTKQKLKAALTQNIHKNVLNSNMKVMSEAVDRVTSAREVTSIIKTQAIPVVQTNPIQGQSILVKTQPKLIPKVQMQAADTTEPSNKRRRSEEEESDPDDRRKKFLERNRAAAARCRQKRKTWITNLETKADELQSTNVKLQNEVSLLRNEVTQLKQLLLAHKDCPITIQQRNSGQLQIHTVPLPLPAEPVQTVTQETIIISESQEPTVVHVAENGEYEAISTNLTDR